MKFAPRELFILKLHWQLQNDSNAMDIGALVQLGRPSHSLVVLDS